MVRQLLVFRRSARRRDSRDGQSDLWEDRGETGEGLVGRHVTVRQGLLPQFEIARGLGDGQPAQGAAVRKHDYVVRWAFLDGDGFALVQGVHLAVRNHGIVGKVEVQLQPFEAVIESRETLE